MSENILRRKIRQSAPKPVIGPQLDIGQYLEKAVALAGLSRLQTQIEAKTDSTEASSPVQFVEGLFESGLNLMISGSKTPYLGIVSLNCELVSSLTDVLTGDLAGARPTDIPLRHPTSADAAMCHGFINGVLAEIDGILAEQQPDFLPPAFEITGRESEPSAHMFPEIPHITATLEVDIDDGARGGKFAISVPVGIWGGRQVAALTSSQLKPDPKWIAALKAAVETAPAQFDAVLYRKKMTIGEIMKLKTGDILEFPATALENLTLEASQNGEKAAFMTARLGEYQEMRAARISNIGPTQSAPDQQKLLASG
ncbi:MAG: FliM/FliN family flagellar motor switch protein [Rhodobacteraceae bacterium]|nr:FliM/FliN family flagellar motor switch protein [Paracoccaceae bacterium]